MPLAASVLIDGPSELVFDYAIPDHLEVLPGCRVRIPLRNRDATGTVLRIQEAPQSEFDLRFLTGLVDPEPLITPALLKLAEWITSYYGTPLEQVIRSIIPASIRGEKTSAKIRKAAILANPPTESELAKLAKGPNASTKLSTCCRLQTNQSRSPNLGGHPYPPQLRPSQRKAGSRLSIWKSGVTLMPTKPFYQQTHLP